MASSSSSASAAQLLLFVIVGKNEPLYEAEFHKTGTLGSSDSVTRQNYFVLHSALDLVEKAAWTTNAMYLKVVDKVRAEEICMYVCHVYIYMYRYVQLNDQRTLPYHLVGLRTFCVGLE